MSRLTPKKPKKKKMKAGGEKCRQTHEERGKDGKTMGKMSASQREKK